jgi:hypothetical protein
MSMTTATFKLVVFHHFAEKGGNATLVYSCQKPANRIVQPIKIVRDFISNSFIMMRQFAKFAQKGKYLRSYNDVSSLENLANRYPNDPSIQARLLRV